MSPGASLILFWHGTPAPVVVLRTPRKILATVSASGPTESQTKIRATVSREGVASVSVSQD